MFGANVSNIFRFGSPLWQSFKERVHRELSLNDAVEYLILKYVCEDYMKNKDQKTLITKDMLSIQKIEFDKLLKIKGEQNAGNA